MSDAAISFGDDPCEPCCGSGPGGEDVCDTGSIDALLVAYPILCMTMSSACPAFDGLTRRMDADPSFRRWRATSLTPSYLNDLGCLLAGHGTSFSLSDKGNNSLNTTNYVGSIDHLPASSISPPMWTFDLSVTALFDYYGCGVPFIVHIVIVVGPCP